MKITKVNISKRRNKSNMYILDSSLNANAQYYKYDDDSWANYGYDPHHILIHYETDKDRIENN